MGFLLFVPTAPPFLPPPPPTKRLATDAGLLPRRFTVVNLPPPGLLPYPSPSPSLLLALAPAAGLTLPRPACRAWCVRMTGVACSWSDTPLSLLPGTPRHHHQALFAFRTTRPWPCTSLLLWARRSRLSAWLRRRRYRFPSFGVFTLLGGLLPLRFLSRLCPSYFVLLIFSKQSLPASVARTHLVEEDR